MKILITNLFILSIAFLLSGCSTTGHVYNRIKPDVKFRDNITETVNVDGIAPMNDNRFEAREAALSNAFKTAIERVVGVFVSAHTETKKSKLVEQEVITDANGYIESYNILNEKVDDGMYLVSLRANVNIAKIYKKFGTRDIAVKIKKPKNLRSATALKQILDKSTFIAYAEVVRFDKNEAEVKLSLIDGSTYDVAEFIDKGSYKFKVAHSDYDDIILEDYGGNSGMDFYKGAVEIITFPVRLVLGVLGAQAGPERHQLNLKEWRSF